MVYKKSVEEQWVEENASRVLGVPSEQLITTKLLTIVDAFDEVIVKDILGMFNHKNTQEILNTHRSESFEKAHPFVLNMCFALASVNVHARNYFNKLESARERADKEMKSWESKVDTAIYDQEVTVEIIGALVAFKTALDSLSQALAAVYGYSLKTWGSNGDKVIKALTNNVPDKDKGPVQSLIDFIRDHQSDTKDYIDLRDNLGHGITEYKSTISGFFKRKHDELPQNPRVEINGKVVDCSDLMNGCMQLSGQYCREIIALLLSSFIPDIKIGIQDGRYVWSHNIAAVTDTNTGETRVL